MAHSFKKYKPIILQPVTTKDTYAAEVTVSSSARAGDGQGLP